MVDDGVAEECGFGDCAELGEDVDDGCFKDADSAGDGDNGDGDCDADVEDDGVDDAKGEVEGLEEDVGGEEVEDGDDG